MKKELKDKWIAALKSGQYEQGIGQLRANNRYCCLGVLCNLVPEYGVWVDTPSGLRSRFEVHESVPHVTNTVHSRGCSGILPADLEEFLQLSVPQIDLTELNDVKGKSFVEIAEWIEEHVPVTPE